MPPSVVPEVARARQGRIEVTGNRIELPIHNVGVITCRHPVDDALPLLLQRILPLRIFTQIVQIVWVVLEFEKACVKFIPSYASSSIWGVITIG